MIRSLNVVLFFISILALAGVYVLKYQTETIADDKVAVMRDIARQTTNLSVLRADWAYLSQPNYIEPVVARHVDVLELQIISAEQFGTIADIPMRPQITDDAGLMALLQSLDAGIDPIGDKLSELMTQ